MSSSVRIKGLQGLLATTKSAGIPQLRTFLSELLQPARTVELLSEQMIWRERVHRARFRVDGTERSFILKRLPLDRAHRERLAVRDWLPKMDLGEHGSPLLGAAAAPGADCIWHVYEDLGPGTLDQCAGDPVYVAAAVEVLAKLHTRGAQCAFLGECREFGVGLGEHFLGSGITDGVRVLEALLREDTALTAAQGDVFERLRQRLLELRTEVPRRARLLTTYGGPETLLHGDLWTCNIFVLPESDAPGPGQRTTPGPGGTQAAASPELARPLHVRFIDWDHAGVGYAPYDLSALLLRFPPAARDEILETYSAAVATAGWRLPRRETLNALFETSEYARLTSATLWPALSFYHSRAPWAYEQLVEVERWFAQMQPVLERSA